MRCVNFLLGHAEKATGIALTENAQSEPARRVEAAIQAVVRFFPEAAAGEAQFSGEAPSTKTTDGGDVDNGRARSLYTGKLTARGKEELLAGTQRCSAREVVRALHYMDPLEMPLCSYEWRAATLALIRLSRHLNARLALPRDSRWVTCPMDVVIKQGYAPSAAGGDALMQLWLTLKSGFRVNLRWLGNVRVVSVVGLLVMWLAARLLLSNVVGAVAALAVAGFLVHSIYHGVFPLSS